MLYMVLEAIGQIWRNQDLKLSDIRAHINKLQAYQSAFFWIFTACLDYFILKVYGWTLIGSIWCLGLLDRFSVLLRFISYTTCYYSVQQPISHSLHVLTVLAGRGLNQFQLVATLSAGDQPRLHRVSCQAQSMHSAQSFQSDPKSGTLLMFKKI